MSLSDKIRLDNSNSNREVINVGFIKESIKDFLEEEWNLITNHLDGRIGFMEFANLRLKLINKTFGDKIVGDEK